MNRWLNKVAVVTGSSSGIGATITKDLIKANVQVVGLARRKNLIDEIQNNLPEDKKSLLHSLKCDVTNENDVQKSFEWIERNLGGPDILINNAGILRFGNLLHLNFNEIKATLNINVMGIVNCTREAFRRMKTRNVDGHIVLINSIAGHRIPNMGKGMPSVNIYCPSKYAVKALSEIFTQEFHNLDTKIKMTSVSPGLTETPIVPSDLLKNSYVPRLQPEDVSNAVLFALSTPPHVQVNEIIIQPVGSTF